MKVILWNVKVVKVVIAMTQKLNPILIALAMVWKLRPIFLVQILPLDSANQESVQILHRFALSMKIRLVQKAKPNLVVFQAHTIQPNHVRAKRVKHVSLV